MSTCAGCIVRQLRFKYFSRAVDMQFDQTNLTVDLAGMIAGAAVVNCTVTVDDVCRHALRSELQLCFAWSVPWGRRRGR